MRLLLANGVEFGFTSAQQAGNAELKFFDRATDIKVWKGRKGQTMEHEHTTGSEYSLLELRGEARGAANSDAKRGGLRLGRKAPKFWLYVSGRGSVQLRVSYVDSKGGEHQTTVAL